MDNPVLTALTRGYLSNEVLRETILFKGRAQEQLLALARRKRQEYFPSGRIEFRSVIEVSNICLVECNFCNIYFYSKGERKYIIQLQDLLEIVKYIYHKGRRVLVLQSGENGSKKYIDFVASCVSEIKKIFSDLIIILCMGNLTYNQYRQLREAGTERYILKFETSNPRLYKKIKPGEILSKRLASIENLTKLGFGVGTGNIIGLPGQTIDDIIRDLLFLRQFKLMMMSTSVFIPGENSKYWDKPIGDLNIALNYTALMRIMYPQMLIPTTSSLEKCRRNGLYFGLMAGANVVTIHDGTPVELEKFYPIYSVRRFTPNEKRIRSIVVKANLNFE